jgi:wyosine [tRNA(Phe)-imidazoG37] synthetase (radical SAM superfamily)
MEKAYYPDNIYIFAENTYSESIPRIIEGMKILSEEFGLNPEIRFSLVEENDFIAAVKKIGELIKELKEQKYSIAVDITPGRKVLVAAALIPAVKQKMEYVFYLAVKDLEAKPYMMIPLANQQLRDFVEEAERVKG